MSDLSEKLIKEYVTLCMKHLRKKKYELGLNASATKRILSDLKFAHGPKARGYGGFESISIPTNYWQYGNTVFQEYKRLSKDKVIGNIKVKDDKDILLIIVAHEVSHYVQYTFNLPKHLRKKKNLPHGEVFQTIYRYLRRDLVNPTINGEA